MRQYTKDLFKNKAYIIISSTILLALIVVLIFNFFVMPKTNRYVYNFNSNETITYTLDDLGQIEKKEEVLADLKVESAGDGIYKLSLQKGFFKTKKEARLYIESLFNTKNVSKNGSLYENDKYTVYGVFFSSIIISFVVSYFMMFLIYLKFPHIFKYKYEYDNTNVFRTPFHKSYWKGQITFTKKVKDLTILSVLLALLVALQGVVLPSGFGQLGISLTFIVAPIISLIYGPITGFIIGIFSDILGHFIFNGGTVFIIGYTLNSALTGLIYGLFLYRTKINFSKVLFLRIVVGFFINVALGTIWYAQYQNLNFDGAIAYLYTQALPKNIIYLLPQSVILYLVLKAIVPALKGFSLINEFVEVGYPIDKINFEKEDK